MIQKICVAIFLALICASIAPAQTSPPTITKMGNGLTVILQEDHASDLVGIDIWVKSGSATESAAISGISHYIEHLVFASTAKRSAGDLDIEMESLGATVDARTSRDWAHYSTTISSRYLPRALDALGDAMTGAKFDPTEVVRERAVINSEIDRKMSKPLMICSDYLAKEIFGDHPYGMPVEGSSETIDKLTRDQIADHYAAHYTPPNMAVVLVGDIDAQQALLMIGTTFNFPQAKPASADADRKIVEISSAKTKSIKTQFAETYLALGYMGPPAIDYSDVCATDVLLTYLGFGYRSWLVEELVGKMKLATDGSSEFLTQREPGLISFYIQTSPDKVEEAKTALFLEIERIKVAGIDSSQMESAKRSLLGQFAFQNETFEGRAHSYGFYFAVSAPEFASKYISSVQSITNEDILRVARKYLVIEKSFALTLEGIGGAK